MADRCLPGLEPGFIRLDLERTAHGNWRLVVLAVDDGRYLWSGEADEYEDMTYYEALDVVQAVLDCLDPGTP